jgi:hypothetical protein
MEIASGSRWHCPVVARDGFLHIRFDFYIKKSLQRHKLREPCGKFTISRDHASNQKKLSHKEKFRINRLSAISALERLYLLSLNNN